LKWADAYNFERSEIEQTYQKASGGAIMPMGKKTAPAWMKTEFKNLEEFYQYYTELLGV